MSPGESGTLIHWPDWKTIGDYSSGRSKWKGWVLCAGTDLGASRL